MISAAALAFLLLSPASVAPSPTPRESRPPHQEREASPETMAKALRRRSQGKAKLDDVRIDVYWSSGTHIDQGRVFGNGIGIWNRAVQFSMSRDEVLSILQLLNKENFVKFPDQFGEESETEDMVRLKGRITLTIGSATKRVSQLSDGDQSKEFESIAMEILAVCRRSSGSGVRAASLDEGLEKLAAGTLAPEVSSFMIQQRADRTKPGSASDGWILRIDGRSVVDQKLFGGRPSATARAMQLSDPEFLALTKTLSQARPGGFPQNLYSEVYVDLRFEILDQKKMVTARRYGSMNEQTKGEKQVAFDGIVTELTALHERVERSGRAVDPSVRVRAGERAEEEKEKR
jgi:hypothetical protein